MEKTLRSSDKPRAKATAIGRKRFSRISAVEGIHLSPEMETMFAEFDRKGLSPSARRKLIAQKYGRPR